jgi:hypothetical protein
MLRLCPHLIAGRRVVRLGGAVATALVPLVALPAAGEGDEVGPHLLGQIVWGDAAGYLHGCPNLGKIFSTVRASGQMPLVSAPVPGSQRTLQVLRHQLDCLLADQLARPGRLRKSCIK